MTRIRHLLDIRNLLIGLFGVVAYLYVASVLDKQGTGISHFVLTEWAINYSAGFIRRGLSGEAIVWIQDLFNLEYEAAIAIIAYSAYFLFATYCLWHIYRLKNSLPAESVAILLFLPAFIVFPMLNSSALGRKENLFLLLLIGHVQWLNICMARIRQQSREQRLKRVRQYLIVVAVLYNGIGIALTLIHESFLILSVPINMLLTFIVVRSVYGRGKSAFHAFAIYAPTIVVSLSIYVGMFDPGPSHQKALIICQQFEHVERITCDDMGAVGALWQTPHQAVWRVYKYIILREGVFPAYLVLMVLYFFLAAYAGVSVMTAQLRKDIGLRESLRVSAGLLVMLLVLPTLATAPLYAVALDWGRWTFTSITSFLLCCLGCRHIFTVAAVESSVAAAVRSRTDNHEGEAPFGAMLRSIAIVAGVYVLTSTNMPVCCMDDVGDAVKSLTSGMIDEVVAGWWN